MDKPVCLFQARIPGIVPQPGLLSKVSCLFARSVALLIPLPVVAGCICGLQYLTQQKCLNGSLLPPPLLFFGCRIVRSTRGLRQAIPTQGSRYIL